MRRNRLFLAALAALLASAAVCQAEPLEVLIQKSLRGAQEPGSNAEPATQAATNPEFKPDDTALSDALNFDAAGLTGLPAKPLRSSQPKDDVGLNWSRTDNPDGSSAYAVKKPVYAPWDAKVGADVGLSPDYAPAYRPDQPSVLGRKQDSGAAWANVNVPGIATVEARADSTGTQGKLGTTLSRSVPLGDKYSVTLQNSFGVTEALGPQSGPVAGVATVPVGPSQTRSTDRLVKFNFGQTGTTLEAGASNSTFDNITHHRLAAEQKLYGPLSVTTSVTDPGASTSSKSITANFKLTW